MLNNSEFTARLQKVMDYYGLSASALADKLDIQRSSISHLLSERNKPSLDFILKLVENFPEVDILWITLGKGHFPPSAKENKVSFSKNETFQTDLFGEELEISNQKTYDEKKVEQKTENQITNDTAENKKNLKISKIVFFYDNNTFEVFENI